MKDKGFRDNYQYIFAQDGLYGGDQNMPKQEPERYKEIVRRYYKDYTDEQIVERLNLLSTEGCGYVALVNSIFLRFYGQEEQFRSAFGLPMYDAKGKLNFNDLIVDFYCATDNHNRFLCLDYLDKKEDATYPNGKGTNIDNSKWRFERYLKKHGITAKLKPIELETEDIEKHLDKGPIIVSIRPTTLYNKEGNIIHDAEGGHTMSVLSACDDGLVKVASWGGEYYIKHGSYAEYEYYQQVIF
ncbi:MAG: hypothetical protein Q4D51_03240 [Eubacteriales bacterium]|nr:hypothetical protein [Eubacteriales bacterium]